MKYIKKANIINYDKKANIWKYKKNQHFEI